MLSRGTLPSARADGQEVSAGAATGLSVGGLREALSGAVDFARFGDERAGAFPATGVVAARLALESGAPRFGVTRAFARASGARVAPVSDAPRFGVTRAFVDATGAWVVSVSRA